jgi:hypothetical protein
MVTKIGVSRIEDVVVFETKGLFEELSLVGRSDGSKDLYEKE